MYSALKGRNEALVRVLGFQMDQMLLATSAQTGTRKTERVRIPYRLAVEMLCSRAYRQHHFASEVK